MKEKSSFIVYYNWEEKLQYLTMEQKGQFFMALFDYEKYGVLPDDPIIRATFGFIKDNLDSNKAKYENICKRNRDNGYKGGRPKTQKNPVGYFGDKKNPK